MRAMQWWGALLISLVAQTLAAQPYPTRPIRLVIPYPPGGPTDFVGRTVGQKLSQALGQQIVVDNRPGAGTIIGSELVARAAPDGYTFLVASDALPKNEALYAKLNYDLFRDLAPVAKMADYPIALAAYTGLPANNVRELVALAKAKPGALNFASVGTGTSPHLGGELFQALAGIKLVHVPYKGTAPAVTDLISGQVHILFTSMPTVLAHVQAGRLRLLGTGGAKRSAVIPDTPPIAETLPGFDLVTWYGIFAPARTPDAIIRRLNAEIVKALADPESHGRLAAQGLEPAPMTPEELRRYTQQDSSRWARLIKAAGIGADK